MALKIGSRVVQLMKAHVSANYMSRTVLSNSSFDYVELWLRNKSGSNYREALFYWEQSRHFYNASLALPLEAKPLTAYYCIMNAAKSLLAIQGIGLSNIAHGVGSDHSNQKTNLANIVIVYRGSGVLGELCKYLGESVAKKNYSVKDLLYNIPCIHRTFVISYPESAELFIPVSKVFFDTDNCTPKNCFIRFVVDKRYSSGTVTKYIPNSIFVPTLDQQPEIGKCYKVKTNFTWDIHKQQHERLKELLKYHKKYRSYFHYIHGQQLLWYIKKDLPGNQHLINRSSMTLIYGVMHWMSELVRYNPALFNRLLHSKYNWLLKEFVEISLPQFVDEIASEITGSIILNPGYRK